MGIVLKENMRILFQGDSITDGGRTGKDSNGDMGTSYAFLTAGRLMSRHPDLNLTVINRGISGDRTKDLSDRWTRDCIELKPDIVSILIGINNTWRKYDRNDATPADVFYKEYRSILERTKKETSAQIVICEPFVLPYPDDRKVWREDLDPKIDACRSLAREFAAVYVPYDGIFAAASLRAPMAYWAHDGVHPTPAGHALMSRDWVLHVLGS
jgi:lysophospholipase L1-like esterase